MLKPCPFCGADALLHDERIKGGAVGWREYRVMCLGTDCDVDPASHTFSKKEDAIVAWNRRSGPDAQMLEALKGARDHVWACWDNGDAEYADEIKADLDKIDAAITSAESERPEGAFLPDPPSKVE